MDEKKKQMTIRLRQREQKETAEMVAEQSRQMLDLVRAKQEEAMHLYKSEIVSVHITMN